MLFYHLVSKDGGTFQNRIAASESSAFSSHGKHRIPANALSPIRREQTAASISSRGVVRHFFCAPCNASQQSELLPAELEASLPIPLYINAYTHDWIPSRPPYSRISAQKKPESPKSSSPASFVL